MDALDIKISKRLRSIAERLNAIVKEEIGEELGIGLVIFPFTREGETSRIAEYQYVSNCPRIFMHNIFKILIAKWDQGTLDIPPHEKQ